MHDMTPERHARILLSHLTEPGDADAGLLVQEEGATGAVLAILDGEPTAELANLIQRTRPRNYRGVVEEIIQRCEASQIQVLIPSDPEWPAAQLADLGIHAPHVLYVRGDANAMVYSLPHSVALVGARAATSYGDHIAMDLAGDLARDHVTVSGAAYGIDASVHRATLYAGGTTIAVLAGGIDRPYPAGHTELIGKIIERGAVVGEVPPGSAPTKWRFLQRNRIIAALGTASIVVEAGFRSGSLNEAGHARGIGRPVGAVPGPLTSAASAGCHRLIREEGATLITSADDVRELTGATKRVLS